MWLVPPAVRIFLARERADMRKSFNGLTALVRQYFPADPLSGHLFVFVGRRQDRLKILYWDRTGQAIWYKKLERGRFHLPAGAARVVEMDAANLSLILEGIDLARTHRFKRFALPAAGEKISTEILM